MNVSKTITILKAVAWGILALLFPVASGVLVTVLKLGAVSSLCTQAACIALSLVIPALLVMRGKMRWRDIGIANFNAAGCKRSLYFLPLLLMFIPAAVCGFTIKSIPYLLGNLALYAFVGLSEEVFFRGVIPGALGKAFKPPFVMLLSTVIFSVGHAAGALGGRDGLDIALTVFNALIFGLLAMEITLLSGNICIACIVHFLFDFETKIAAMNSASLLLAECARGAVMTLLVVWLAFVLKSQKRAPLCAEAKQKRRKRRVTALCVCGAVILLAGAGMTALMLYGQSQTQKIPAMTADECLSYTLSGSEDGVITVGVIQNGQTTVTVYGKNGAVLPNDKHLYEIGSLTKTFTAALAAQAVDEGRLRLDTTLDAYLPLPEENHYPTIAQLLTHTSGYAGYYMEMPMIGNKLSGRNDFCGVTDDMTLRTLETLSIGQAYAPFIYSNFGYAALGLALERVYDADYTALVNQYAQSLGLDSTRISDGVPLQNGWDWRTNDAYLSAGALVSDINDMLRYAEMQLSQQGAFGQCHEKMKQINASSAQNAFMDIHMDGIGMAWLLDEKNNIIWHNGGTGHYNCYLGISTDKNAAVVVLSNLAPAYRIPATVIGVKLLKSL